MSCIHDQTHQSRAIVTWERPLPFRLVHSGDPPGSPISFSGRRSVLPDRSVGYTTKKKVPAMNLSGIPIQDIEDNEHGALQSIAIFV